MEQVKTSVCLITRGVAPARCVIDSATRAAQYPCFRFHLIEGRPAVEAKNLAVQVADASGEHLLLLEDDIIAPEPMWASIAEFSICPEFHDLVAFGGAKDRSGNMNIYRNAASEILWSGTVFLWIPRPILDRLPRPLFEAWDYSFQAGGQELVRIGPNATGHHSDVDAWTKIRQLTPRPEIHLAGKVDHHMHRDNAEHNLQNPHAFDVT